MKDYPHQTFISCKKKPSSALNGGKVHAKKSMKKYHFILNNVRNNKSQLKQAAKFNFRDNKKMLFSIL